MGQLFTPEFLEELKFKTDIVELVSHYVPLQKKGGRYSACCPFHSEKTPSFYVDAQQGYYHCFGCGVSGDVISFVEEMESLDFASAVKYLAEKAGIPIPETVEKDPQYQVKKDHKEVLKQIMRDAARYYRNCLLDENKGKEARAYLAERGISDETSARYGLGLSPDYDSAVGYLRRKGYKLSDLRECGLIASETAPSDSFGRRIIVPIISSMNNVIAFGGRIYHGEKDKAKYKNSTNTVLFDKSRTVYGINFIKYNRAVKAEAQKQTILVEGYMDVIALGAAGINNAVAGMGTALTEGQAREIKRVTDRVAVCYDGDEAGRHASLKNLDVLDAVGLDVRVVSLPDGLDPDETVRKEGAQGFMRYVEAAKPLVDYKLERCKDGLDMTSADGRSKYLAEARKVLNSISETTKREVYMTKVAHEGAVSENAMREIMQGGAVPADAKKRTETPAFAQVNAARFVLYCLMNNEKFAEPNDINVDWFEDETHLKIVKYAERVPYGKLKIGSMLGEIAGEEINKILDVNEELTPDGKEKKYRDCVNILEKNRVSKRLEKLRSDYASATDREEKRKTLAEINELLKQLRFLQAGGVQ